MANGLFSAGVVQRSQCGLPIDLIAKNSQSDTPSGQQMRSFSLKTFLVAIIVLALLLAYGTLQCRYWKLEAEVLQLRIEGGHLVPVDKRRVNVIEVPSSDPMLFQWRIYAPPGTVFDYGLAINDIPERGLPKRYSGGEGLVIKPIESGVLFTFEIIPEDDGGHDLVLGLGSLYIERTSMQLPLGEWFRGSHSSYTTGSEGAQAFEYDDPIILYRRRMYDSWNVPPQGDARGFMIWLIPKRKP